VIRFQADEDFDIYDAEYTDILLTCTHNILKGLKEKANPSPLVEWLKSRWQALKDLALTEVSIENLSIEAQMGLFGREHPNYAKTKKGAKIEESGKRRNR
jgi:hypothetical protein